MMDFIQHSSIQDLEAIRAAGATNRLLAEDDEPAAWPQPPYHRFDGGLLRIYTDLSSPSRRWRSLLEVPKKRPPRLYQIARLLQPRPCDWQTRSPAPRCPDP